ncbi:MAG TPA: OmpA family protein [Kiloniellales bacterium]|jgi:OOP family OmpA-OmpF porin|nr:OmpA family protein [Kiloniellales bacterium]
MISLRKTCFAVASAFALTMAVNAAPASAQYDDPSHGHEWCNPITNITPTNVIHSSNGAPVLQRSSYPCPVQAQAPVPAPAPAAPQTYTVYFDFDRSNIRPDAEPVLRQALEAAQANNSSFALTGHTDTVGTAEYNMGLSLRRAESVRNWLGQQGVPGSEVSVAGRGFSEPAVPTGPQVREQRNRRVEIILQ